MQRRRLPQNQSVPEELVAQLRLDELKLFNLVAKLGSFSTAAKQLGITQPTASRRLCCNTKATWSFDTVRRPGSYWASRGE